VKPDTRLALCGQCAAASSDFDLIAPKEPGLPIPITPRHWDVPFWGKFMATDAEIEAAFNAMRAIRTSGGEVHDDVLRA
jgi:hypothetical protein